ncbi:MAG TPA: hypothetical protein VH497_16515 [Vicinamibacterales bacterium]|jgi:hypothetical protein
MTFDEFRTTLLFDQPPAVAAPLIAMWHDARGDWHKAHAVAQEIDDEVGAWIHAYLHRKEGDADNAAYWYGRARQPIASDSLDAEWTRITTALLGSG